MFAEVLARVELDELAIVADDDGVDRVERAFDVLVDVSVVGLSSPRSAASVRFRDHDVGVGSSTTSSSLTGPISGMRPAMATLAA